MASPFRSTRYDPYSLSSSPGLPSLDQIKSQIPRRPPIRSGSAAMPIPSNASHGFTSASGFLRDEHSAIDLTTPSKPPTEMPNLPPEEEVTVISLSTLTSKPRRKRGAKVLEKKVNEPPSNTKHTKARDLEASPPWKKYLKTKDASEKQEKKTKGKSKAPSKKGETVSRHFAKPKDKDKEQEPAPIQKDADEPLELERALRRRMDWTPPPADTAIESEASQVVDLLSSTAKSSSCVASKETFGNLFKNFGRTEDEPVRPSVEPPDGEIQVLRKRKLIETVSINDSSKAAPAGRVAKAKAPKKKPRTITELATAAYVVADATEQGDPTAIPVESVEDDEETMNVKKKKRASKAKKPKKMPPPEPVLLSPTAALRQAANQDYVFGTSSQLAREHSPTFLRDLHAALQASNSRRREDDPFVTPVNSDAVDPEPQQKLWCVGARDEDGRVLDLEVINLADTPQPVAGEPEGPNPFGYVAVEKSQAESLPAHFPSEDSFPDIDVLLSKEPLVDLPRERKKASTTSAIPPSTAQPAAAPTLKEASPSGDEALVLLHEEDSFGNDDIDLPPVCPPSRVTEKATTNPASKTGPKLNKPNFDLYTDNQLAREISSYGFKPVKRRQAMLALLDQCWSSKQRTVLSSLPTNHPISTTAQSQAAANAQGAALDLSPKRPRGRPRKNSDIELSSSPKRPRGRPRKYGDAELLLRELSPKRPRGRPRKYSDIELSSREPSPKRPRGRPRKNSNVEVTSSEPPASAQPPPPPSPKRPRGRPKKAVEPTGTCGSTTGKEGKSKAAEEMPANLTSPAASPRGQKPKSREAIEIPDSASEGSLSPSPYSSPEPTFSSPPPVDVSLSVGEDTEMSLAASPTCEQSTSLFACITQAVTSAPPTTDPKTPSFHEMMLMYDPIVLEDLAAWLNTGQLSRVGYDGEVSAAEVKQWCESKSVCCLWRENLRGTERKRY